MTVGEKHYQTVNSDPLSGCGRKSVLQRSDKVSVIVHGLIIAGILLFHLSSEAGGLILGVVKLGECISQLTSGNIELKTIGLVIMMVL